MSRVAGVLPQDRICEAASDTSDSSHDEDEDVRGTSEITVRVHVKQASGLPPSLSNFVFCQYTFWNHPDPIAVAPSQPESHNALSRHKDSMTVKFNDARNFPVVTTEEFLEHCAGNEIN